MTGTTYTYIGNPGSAISPNGPSYWSPALPAGQQGPNSGDSVIVNAGTIVLQDAGLQSNTLFLGGGTLQFYGGSGTSGGFIANTSAYSSPTLDWNSVITTNVAAAGTTPGSPQTATLDLFGNFINDGTIAANGVAGSSLTLAIAGTTIAGTINGTVTSTYYPGYAINYGEIDVLAGNSMTITVAGTSELFNAGQIQVQGGYLLIASQPGAIAGGYAPVGGTVIITGGGTLETNAGYAATLSGAAPFYAFGDAAPGNMLKIDNIGAFGGRIVAFGTNDIIDLGTSLAVASAVYSAANGILELDNASGTAVASLRFSSGNFTSGTFAVSGSTAGSFNIATGPGGNTQITTAVQNDVYRNTSGTWQTAANWSGGLVPGASDTTVIGAGAQTQFALTTGGSPVSTGALIVASNRALLQITSNTTVGPYGITQFGGTIDVTAGNTLAAAALRMLGGTVAVDPGGVFNVTGHTVTTTIGDNGGTLAISNTATGGVEMTSGTLLVNGGTLNAGSASSYVRIGSGGSGTPASVTVQNSGTNAGKVTAAFTVLSSDPTSFGALTLNGTASWTDSTYMLVGYNNQVGNSGTIAPPGFANAATLLVENGATLTEGSYVDIGTTAGSAGSATVQSAGIWNIGSGGIGIGYGGAGTLNVLSAGTVAVGIGGIGLGSTLATASGTLTVSGANSLVTTSGGASVGRTGQGLMEVLNGGTVALTGTRGILVGVSAGSVGTIIVSGIGALINEGTAGTGIGIGRAGTGTVEVQNGGTISLNGTASANGIGIGQTAGAQGYLLVSGSGALLSLNTPLSGISVGSGGQGTLDVEAGGTVSIIGTGIGIGNQATTGNGTVIVAGTGSSITTFGTAGRISVGSIGSGVLNINGGGVVSASAGLIVAGSTSTSTGTVTVDNGTLTASGIGVGNNGAGTLTVQNAGLVSNTGINGIAVGVASGASGTVVVNNGTLSNSSFFSVGGAGARGSVLIGNAGTVSGNGFIIGNGGSGALTIQSAGLLSNTGTNSFDIGGSFNLGGTGSVVVDGGSLVTNGGLQVGNTNAFASLLVQNNGQLITNGPTIFSNINSTGSGTASAIISGGTWSANTGIIVGDSGTGSLIVSNGGVINAGTNTIFIGNHISGSGTVTIGSARINAGSLNIANNATVASTLTVNTGGTVSGLTNLNIGSLGTLSMAGGTLSVSGPAQNTGLITGFGTLIASLNNSGTITASGGRLVVTGGETGTGTDTIANGATLEEDFSVGSGQSISFVNGATASALQLNVLSSQIQNFGLSNWQNGDRLYIANGVTVNSASFTNGTTLQVFTTGGEYDFTNVSVAAGASPIFATGTNFVELICFCAGTLIGTPAGEVPVQTLKAGDIVLTAHNGPRKVTWLGKGKVLSTRGKRTAATPVIVRKGALADNVPARDLHVTKAHSLYIDEVLIPVEFLVNHKTIIWDDRAQEVEIYHVELESHDILIANGAPAESYRDDGNRWLFQNANSGWHLPPQEPYAEVLTGGPLVDAIWQRLLDRAGPRNLPPMTDDADVHLIADGKRVDAIETLDFVRVFRLSGRPASVHIASREVVPAELGIARDPRPLGVALRRMAVRQGTKFEIVLAKDVRLSDGFHAYEDAVNLRWTDGFAALPVDIFAQFSGGVEVVLTLAGTTRYPLFGDSGASVAA